MVEEEAAKDQRQQQGLKTRLLDTGRAPRSWFYLKLAWPFYSSDAIPSGNKHEVEELLQRQYEEASRTLRRTMFSILAFSLFSIMTLLQPDEKLLASNATIKLPVANVDIGYVGFLIAGPTVLIGLWLYQKVFQEYLRSIQVTSVECEL